MSSTPTRDEEVSTRRLTSRLTASQTREASTVESRVGQADEQVSEQWVDLGEWLEPERADGGPRAYKPYKVFSVKDRNSNPLVVLGEFLLHSPEST